MTGSVPRRKRCIYQALIDAELIAVIGAGPWESSEARTVQAQRHAGRVLTTTAGDLKLRTPKLRTGSFFRSLLERRKTVAVWLTRGHLAELLRNARTPALSVIRRPGYEARGDVTWASSQSHGVQAVSADRDR
jgi:hypothetical protein